MYFKHWWIFGFLFRWFWIQSFPSIESLTRFFVIGNIFSFLNSKIRKEFFQFTTKDLLMNFKYSILKTSFKSENDFSKIINKKFNSNIRVHTVKWHFLKCLDLFWLHENVTIMSEHINKFSSSRRCIIQFFSKKKSELPKLFRSIKSKLRSFLKSAENFHLLKSLQPMG